MKIASQLAAAVTLREPFDAYAIAQSGRRWFKPHPPDATAAVVVFHSRADC
jgi:hypothetical protein